MGNEVSADDGSELIGKYLAFVLTISAAIQQRPQYAQQLAYALQANTLRIIDDLANNDMASVLGRLDTLEDLAVVVGQSLKPDHGG